MENKMDFIVFSEDWGGHPSSTQHIFRQLIKRGHRVVWFNSIGLRNPSFNLRDVKRIFVKIYEALFKKRDADTVEKVERYAPVEVIQSLVFPKADNPLFRAVNKFLLGRKIREAAERLGLESPVLWITTPSAECVTDAMEYKKILYYCCDDYGSLPGVDPDFVEQLEKRLSSEADDIIITNHGLGQRFPEGKTHYIPHGVDYDLFTSANDRPDELPPSPVAGFYGSISDWLDIGLLVNVVKSLPEWNFVFIGNVATEVGELEALDNVHFLGPKDHSELVRYAANWDVSLMPFRQCEQIEKCNPLKLREYLAVGRPVVSVTFPAVAEFSELISLVDYADAESFAEGIRQSLNDDIATELRRKTVEQESWTQRAMDIEALAGK